MSTSILWQKTEEIISQANIPERHTFFQIRNFILGKEPTIQGKLWQATKEIRARKESVENLELQLEELQDNIALVEIQIRRIQNDKQVSEENEIGLRKLERQKNSLLNSGVKLKNQMKYIMEEVSYLVSAFEFLSKTEAMKPIDDIDAQKEYWNAKLSEELNLRLLLKNGLDTDFIKTILCLDDDAYVKKQAISILEQTQKHAMESRERLLTRETNDKNLNTR
jgi:hypothetical protein